MDTHDLVRIRAYELWEKDGCKPGLDTHYWEQAEQQILEESMAEAQALTDQMVAVTLPKLSGRSRKKAG
jgi:hypothetical protein